GGPVSTGSFARYTPRIETKRSPDSGVTPCGAEAPARSACKVCGICGVVARDPRAIADRAAVERMTHALRHRGPDGQGVHIDGPAALGHTRLSIIDVSDAGRQPMTN